MLFKKLPTLGSANLPRPEIIAIIVDSVSGYRDPNMDLL